MYDTRIRIVYLYVLHIYRATQICICDGRHSVKILIEAEWCSEYDFFFFLRYTQDASLFTQFQSILPITFNVKQYCKCYCSIYE